MLCARAACVVEELVELCIRLMVCHRSLDLVRWSRLLRYACHSSVFCFCKSAFIVWLRALILRKSAAEGFALRLRVIRAFMLSKIDFWK